MCSVSMWNCNHFFSKLEFWVEFFWIILFGKKLILHDFEPIFCQNRLKLKKKTIYYLLLKAQKRTKFIDIISLKYQVLQIWTCFWARNRLKRPGCQFFYVKIVHKNLQLIIPIMGKNDCITTWKLDTLKIHYLWHSQQWSKVSKICGYFDVIYFDSFGNLQANTDHVDSSKVLKSRLYSKMFFNLNLKLILEVC